SRFLETTTRVRRRDLEDDRLRVEAQLVDLGRPERQIVCGEKSHVALTGQAACPSERTRRVSCSRYARPKQRCALRRRIFSCADGESSACAVIRPTRSPASASGCG